jgi:predicted transposase YdaD
MPGENLPEIHELQEVETMLAEYVEEWTEKWKREGLLAGRLEGERKGKLEGKRDTLKRLLRRRFGELPPWASACIEEASVAQLDAWVDGIFAAETLETLLDDSPPASSPSAG